MNKYIEITIDEFTSPTPISVNTNETLENILILMTNKGIRHLPVLSDNKPVGIISERDINMIKQIYQHNTGDLTAKDIMTEDPFCVHTGSQLEDVALEMSKRKIGSALVLNDKNQLDGIFTSTDGLNALIEIIRGDLQ